MSHHSGVVCLSKYSRRAISDMLELYRGYIYTAALAYMKMIVFFVRFVLQARLPLCLLQTVSII